MYKPIEIIIILFFVIHLSICLLMTLRLNKFNDSTSKSDGANRRTGNTIDQLFNTAETMTAKTNTKSEYKRYHTDIDFKFIFSLTITKKCYSI